MKQLQLNGYTLGVVDVPEDADCFEMSELGRVITFELLDDNCDQYDWDYIKPPPGQWSILGRLDSITEEQAAGLVKYLHLQCKYMDYTEKENDMCAMYLPLVDTAAESLQSFFRSHGITGNPLIILNENK